MGASGCRQHGCHQYWTQWHTVRQSMAGRSGCVSGFFHRQSEDLVDHRSQKAVWDIEIWRPMDWHVSRVRQVKSLGVYDWMFDRLIVVLFDDLLNRLIGWSSRTRELQIFGLILIGMSRLHLEPTQTAKDNGFAPAVNCPEIMSAWAWDVRWIR